MNNQHKNSLIYRSGDYSFGKRPQDALPACPRDVSTTPHIVVEPFCCYPSLGLSPSPNSTGEPYINAHGDTRSNVLALAPRNYELTLVYGIYPTFLLMALMRCSAYFGNVCSLTITLARIVITKGVAYRANELNRS
ncbi:hypothetical protein HAX54_044274 [Datura stramonium]|uniref:Uncharacterized protein n=1 Tax=Datura stramonium TaxID=4076 RepID=A0ABS8W4C0_DATST|nr:hypothetical protein [Datura stramonium]